jgi:hypothetical protein
MTKVELSSTDSADSNHLAARNSLALHTIQHCCGVIMIHLVPTIPEYFTRIFRENQSQLLG